MSSRPLMMGNGSAGDLKEARSMISIALLPTIGFTCRKKVLMSKQAGKQARVNKRVHKDINRVLLIRVVVVYEYAMVRAC